ncbi:MAG: TniQ family protein [Luteimonas sp.]
MRVEVTKQRWWIRPPLPDESLGSVLRRAAALYERSASQIWESLNRDDPVSPGDVESPSCAALRRMAAAIGMPVSQLLAQRQSDAPWLLVPQARNIYCPMCWNEDRGRGLPCYIRRGWSRVLQTTCPDHSCPLRLASEQWATSALKHRFQPPCFTQQEQQILGLIKSFGEALDRSLYLGDRWPSEWRGSPQIARQLLLAVSFNVNEVRDFPLINYAQVTGNLKGFIRGPLHLQEPVKKLRWDAFRAVADPAFRRAGLWATAWALIPELSADLSPGWLKLPPHIEARMRPI